MNIAEQIQVAMAEHLAEPKDKEELSRLQEFLQKMMDAGVAKKQQYDIPQLDTIGRSLVVR